MSNKKEKKRTPKKKNKKEPIKFAHPSEKVCADILNYYGIEWEYEPTEFPLAWDKEGNVIQSFTPDFYLPQFDLYIELTTMSQKLVTKKNRKVRQLKELYPHINIKIFYQRDFRKLLMKYGLDKPALSQGKERKREKRVRGNSLQKKRNKEKS